MSSNLSTSTTNPQLRSHRATQLGSLWSHMFEDKPRQRCSSSNPRRKPRMKKFLAQPFAGPSLVTILMQMLRKRRQPGLLCLVEEDNPSLLLTWIAERCAVWRWWASWSGQSSEQCHYRTWLQEEKACPSLSARVHGDTPLHITKSEATHGATTGDDTDHQELAEERGDEC